MKQFCRYYMTEIDELELNWKGLIWFDAPDSDEADSNQQSDASIT